ncbi:cyclic peptide export ABC transporter [Xanthobacter autotrophicus]|uniref:cyclic peptide export ABC transporter n=1 Tax=Xanthobacter TaxID=279 RepID=UPI0024AC71BF|nr:cyclic peptide export ABC transporter [Xanthobacter autotrophicus]MDI4664952.1 cyclic peptide export ABC transporter [Xanthobacter autotrophicus]
MEGQNPAPGATDGTAAGHTHKGENGFSLLSFVFGQNPLVFSAATATSLLSGLAAVALIILINLALAPDRDDLVSLGLAFAAVAALTVALQTASGILFGRLGQEVLARLRARIAERVEAAPLRAVEQVGPARIQALVTDDVFTIATVVVRLPVLFTNAVAISGCLFYLAWLSTPLFLGAAGMMALGVAGYMLVAGRARHHLEHAGGRQDALFAHLSALVLGTKELKLNRAKAEDFRSRHLGAAIESVRRARTHGITLLALGSAWGSLIVFGFIGLVLFVFSGGGTVATGYAVVLLFLIGPLAAVMEDLPRLALARVAGQRLARTEAALAARAEPGAIAVPFESLVLGGVTHAYWDERTAEMFRLGPVDLAFAPGEIVFLVGGNGSGKTTLAKLVTGLYAPESGTVRLNGAIVDETSRSVQRALFSAVFGDFHLFESLVGLSGAPDIDARANRLISRLALTHKVSVEDGRFSTRDLSTGQRKRLALVAAVLEDRPFLVFDEWAADQDPAFKAVFYRELLPELKALGKSVLVISHDDRYFDCGDRVVHMENGQVTADAPAAGGAARSGEPKFPKAEFVFHSTPM